MPDDVSTSSSDRIEAAYLLPVPSPAVLSEVFNPGLEAGCRLLDAVRAVCSALATAASAGTEEDTGGAAQQLPACLQAVHDVVVEIDTTLDATLDSGAGSSADSGAHAARAECRLWLQAAQACVLQQQRQASELAGESATAAGDAAWSALCADAHAVWSAVADRVAAGGASSDEDGAAAPAAAASGLQLAGRQAAGEAGTGASWQASTDTAAARSSQPCSKRVCGAPHMPYAKYWARKIAI